MRRKDRQIPEQEAREILAQAEHGVLATVGADGWPYAVPVNHVLVGDTLYIHCATEGHKLDNLACETRVCYCAVPIAMVVPEELSTLYESAIVFGRAAIVSDPEEKRYALERLCIRFCGQMTEATQQALRGWFSQTAVIRIAIQRITGKAHRAKPE